MINDKFKCSEIVSHFIEDFELISCEKYGNGHINSTFIVLGKVKAEESTYILQKINNNVFKKPELVMDNIKKVTSHMIEKVDNSREVLHFLKCDKGTLCYKDHNDEYWRMYKFVDNCKGVDRPSMEEFYESGVAFGKFQNLLSDFSAETLNETIPDFHNTPKRYETFLKSVQDNTSGRKDNCLEEIEFVKARADFYPTLINANKKGKLMLRVSHNDTKSNNVLLDDLTHKAVCVIDLDTIMPGFSVTDFGDSIRFGANTAAEDEADLTKVNFDIQKFRIFAKGFIEGCGGRLPKEEIELLPEGALMMTLECGIRFLTDYLDGDVYFRTSYPEHNLVRSRTQFKLASEMEKHWSEIKKIVIEFASGI
jgi:Ser/Thr protein kinase RdoA (MazF antagonist)